MTWKWPLRERSGSLTREEVEYVRSVYTGAKGQKAALARQFGVYPSAVGKVLPANPVLTREQMFWEKVDRRGPDDCWEWTAARDRQGYGQFWDPERQTMGLAHRFSYELASGGPLPSRRGVWGPSGDDLVLHSCDNKPCVNPAHLSLGDHQRNVREAVDRGRLPDYRGTRNPNAKLSDGDIAAMRAMATGRYGERSEIARRFGISTGYVTKILAGDNRIEAA